MDCKEIKVVIVTMFEPKEGCGELHFYREGLGLSPLSVPGLNLEALYINEKQDVLAIVTGMGTANTAIAITALGLCPAFDLSKAYWLISGIAGGNPNVCSIGSVVWAEWCIDGDLAYEIDARELPEGWPTGILPLGASQPYKPSKFNEDIFEGLYQHFHLDAELREWAYRLTQSIELQDTETLATYRTCYKASKVAQQPPSVRLGDTLAAARFWHGTYFNTWAERWVRFWTQDQGSFATSNMEDTGTLQALHHLDRLGRAKAKRVLLLRSISNYTVPPPGITAAQHLEKEGLDYSGLDLALKNAFRVGGTVVKALVKRFETALPSPPE